MSDLFAEVSNKYSPEGPELTLVIICVLNILRVEGDFVGKKCRTWPKADHQTMSHNRQNGVSRKLSSEIKANYLFVQDVRRVTPRVSMISVPEQIPGPEKVNRGEECDIVEERMFAMFRKGRKKFTGCKSEWRCFLIY